MKGWLRTHRLVLVAALVAVAPIFWNAWSAAADGWVPEGDSATLTLRTHDVFTAHPPLLGNPTTAGREEFGEVYHPGPLEFELLAIPLRLFGADAHGMLFGAAVINAASVVGIAWFAHRRGGRPLALWALSGAAVLAWSLNDEILHDPYNPHILLLPYAFLLVAGWSVACRDKLALPFAVAAASFVAQAHAFYALPAAVVVVAIGTAILTFARPGRRALVVAAATGFVLWLPPIISELRPGRGNLAALATYAGDGQALAGPRFALARLADTLLGPRWLDRSPDALQLLSQPGVPLQALTLAALAGVGLLGVRAHRAGRTATAMLVATAGVAALASLVATARLPNGIPFLEPHSHRHWWVAGFAVWFAASWAVADALRDRLRAVPPRVRVGLLAAPLAVAAAATAWTPSIADDRGSVSFGAVAHLTDAVAAELPSRGPWLVQGSGQQAFFSVEPGIVTGLVLRGFDVGVAAHEGAIFGRHHVAPPDVVGTILVISGPAPPAAPPGYELVARFDAAADAAGTGRTNTGIFRQPEQLAVFVSLSSGEG